MIIAGCTAFSTTALDFPGVGSTPNASLALWNFMSNIGREITWPLIVPLGLHKTQRAGFYRQINGLFEVVENTVKPGKTYCFSSTRQSDEQSHTFWLCDLKTGGAYTKQVKEDWFAAIGGSSNALTAEVICCEENGTMSYTAKINYYIYDYYDWGGIAYIATNPENGAGEYRWYGGYGYEGENTLTRGIDNSKKATGQLSVVLPFIEVIEAILIVSAFVYAAFATHTIIANNSKNIDMPGSDIVDNVISSIDTMTETAGETIKNVATTVGSIAIAKAIAKNLRKKNEYFVYLGIVLEEGISKPVYVGITYFPELRRYQHNYLWNKLYGVDRFDYLDTLNDKVKDGGMLTKTQARGVEQVIYERNREREGFQNKIGSISRFNAIYADAFSFGEACLETNYKYNDYKSKGLID